MAERKPVCRHRFDKIADFVARFRRFRQTDSGLSGYGWRHLLLLTFVNKITIYDINHGKTLCGCRGRTTFAPELNENLSTKRFRNGNSRIGSGYRRGFGLQDFGGQGHEQQVRLAVARPEE